ncbi:MAG: pitrilysin family protein [Vicinamibacteria bacterium]
MSAIRHVFENGLTLLVEPLSHVHSVAIGVFVRRGSRHENDHERGLAHFIEHLVFKGTGSRSAEQIAMDVDAMGGHMDAFTSKEYAAFHLRVLDTHVNKSAEILSDILVNPRFDKSDLSKEKTVILEEFSMVDDTPDDILGEMFSEKLWPDHPIGRPILGTRKALKAYTQDDVRKFFKKVYVPSNLVLSIAGRITEKRAVELATRLFASIPKGRANSGSTRPTTHHGVVKKHKETLAQTHLCLGAPGPSSTQANRFAGHVLGTILGGSISSRLFQNVREKRGLVYSISAGLSGFMDTGSMSIYAATSKERIDKVLSLIGDEVKKLVDEAVPQDELQRAKDNLKGGLMLSMEGTGSRMSALARNEIYFRRTVAATDTLRSIDAVTSADVAKLARDIFSREMTLAVIGNLKGTKLRIPEIA